MERLSVEELVSQALDKLREFVRERSRLSTILFARLVLKPLGDAAPIHIASERGEVFVRVFRVGEEPYIPLTSVLGALRSIAETVSKSVVTGLGDVETMILRAHCELEDEGIRHVCMASQTLVDFVKELVDSLGSEPKLYRHIFTEEAMNEVKNLIEKTKRVNEIPRAVEPLLSMLCPLCKLFGGPGLGSSVRIVSIEPRIIATHSTTHIAIDRVSNVVREGHLFVLEKLLLERLEIELYVKNIRPRTIEAKILKTVVDYLKNIGISIGGHKTIGMGRFVLDPNQSRATLIELDKIDEPTKLIHALTEIRDFATEPLEEVMTQLS